MLTRVGVDPGPELRHLYAELLAADANSALSAGNRPASAGADAAVVVGRAPSPALTAGQALPRPAQLPADIADFTGRKKQVAYLYDALARQDVASGRGAVRIVVISGAAGLGKTTLAVHAAHQVGDLFPDGQLYADLSGASAAPAAPGEVLARFLRDLGVDGDRVPTDDEERAALFRTRLAGRRVLIALDDAKDAAQVRPLLPGSASCAVLVTTRNSAPYLLSAGLVDLSTLAKREALELFSRIAGHDRTAAEPEEARHAAVERLLRWESLGAAPQWVRTRRTPRPTAKRSTPAS